MASWKSSTIKVTLPKGQPGEITFRALNGVVVKRVCWSSSASYTLTGLEGYVRVEVRTREGKAWTQPIRVWNARTVSNPYYAAGNSWYKGSVHCHSNKTDDCNMAPADVVGWHAAQGYSFLAITDHNVVTVP